MNENRTYHNLFDRWTEVSAYILGFWYADGCIYLKKYKSGNYRKIFVIKNTDKQIMDSISQIFDVNLHVAKPAKPGYKVQYTIDLYSDKLFDYCYDIIGTTHKSSQSNMPDIPDSYMSHFIRGFFDGDGSIFWVTYKNRHGKPTSELRTSFTSGVEAADTLHWVSRQLNGRVGLPIKRLGGKSHSRQLKFGQYHSALLCEWMYKDAIIFMKRKEVIWNAADKKRLLESRKYMKNK